MSVANHEGSQILFLGAYDVGVQNEDPASGYPEDLLAAGYFAGDPTYWQNDNGGAHDNVVGEDIPDIAYQTATITSRVNTQPIAAIGYRGVPAISDLVGSVEISLEGIICYSSGMYATQNTPTTASGLLGKTLYDFVSQWGAITIYTKGQDTFEGTPIDTGRAMYALGMYVSSIAYNFQQNTNVTTTWNFVGYRAYWGTLLNTDVTPTVGTGINLVPLTSKDIGIEVFYAGSSIPVSGVQSVTFNATLNREEVYQLGTKGPFERPVRFPFEVTAAVEILADYSGLVAKVVPTYEWNNSASPTVPNSIKIFVYKVNSGGTKLAKICGAPYQRPVDGSMRVAVGANSTVTLNTTGWEFHL